MTGRKRGKGKRSKHLIRKIIQHDRVALIQQRTDVHIYNIYTVVICSYGQKENAQDQITAKITLRGYRRIETYSYFLLFLYRVIKDRRENEHKNMRNTYHRLTSLRVSLI